MLHCISNDCTGCGTCKYSCPVDAIKEGPRFVIDATMCIDCGACVDECPVAAIGDCSHTEACGHCHGDGFIN